MTSGRILATAALTDGPSRASAKTGSAPDSEKDALELCERTMPKMVCPASLRLFISGRPIAPVAPATKTLTAPPGSTHYIAWHGGVANQQRRQHRTGCDYRE